MHEYSIVQALYDSVVAQAAAQRATVVHGLHVRIGELSGVDAGLLDTAWKTFRTGTICDRAPMAIEAVEARWACHACGEQMPAGGPLRCRDCGGPLRLTQGDEIVLQRIVMEVPDV